MKKQIEGINKNGEQQVSRRTLLKSGVAVGLAAAVGLVTRRAVGAAEMGQGHLLDLDVVADLNALDIVPSPNFTGQGPFYIPGEIFAPGTNHHVGDFHCWGFFYNGGALGVVSQEYDLFGMGKIQVQGVEDQGPRAVTGGTGDFANVRGEMTGADLSQFPFFTVSFRLIGAKGG